MIFIDLKQEVKEKLFKDFGTLNNFINKNKLSYSPQGLSQFLNPSKNCSLLEFIKIADLVGIEIKGVSK
jgi:hypothetical protein